MIASRLGVAIASSSPVGGGGRGIRGGKDSEPSGDGVAPVDGPGQEDNGRHRACTSCTAEKKTCRGEEKGLAAVANGFKGYHDSMGRWWGSSSRQRHAKGDEGGG
jgi:hypothetical protein